MTGVHIKRAVDVLLQLLGVVPDSVCAIHVLGGHWFMLISNEVAARCVYFDVVFDTKDICMNINGIKTMPDDS